MEIVLKKFIALLALLTPLTVTAAVCDTTELNNINQKFVLAAPACIASGSYTSDECASVRQVPDEFALASANLTKSGCYGGTYNEAPLTSEYNKLITALPGHPPIAATVDNSYDDDICESQIPFIQKQQPLKYMRLVRNGNKDKSKPSVTCMYKANTLKHGVLVDVNVKVVFEKSDLTYAATWSQIPKAAVSKGSYESGVRICNNLISDITSKYNVSNLTFMPSGNPHVSDMLVSCNYRATIQELNFDRPGMVVVLFNKNNKRYTTQIR